MGSCGDKYFLRRELSAVDRDRAVIDKPGSPLAEVQVGQDDQVTAQLLSVSEISGHGPLHSMNRFHVGRPERGS